METFIIEREYLRNVIRPAFVTRFVYVKVCATPVCDIDNLPLALKGHVRFT